MTSGHRTVRQWFIFTPAHGFAVSTLCAFMQGESVKYTRKNGDVQPFEAGGDTNLQHFSQKTDSSLFALGNHSKKRPHNITLGRFFEHQLHDVLELGVERYKGIKEFAKAATAVQLGNKVGLQPACHTCCVARTNKSCILLSNVLHSMEDTVQSNNSLKARDTPLSNPIVSSRAVMW